IGINLFLVMFCNSTITDLFLFVFTQLILHYQNRREISNISYIQNNRKIKKQIIFISPLLLFIAIIGSITIKKNV
ncbi:hypothetical protein EFL52_09215, partial [Streptococcus thermophilus]|nr:hypothetical protein [Streptococcus thermophilus]MCS9995093.1 hypothetical protein [Streptococcus thermophilus]MCT1168320.1 hypothetical protein [Streptococcus thermophilus]